MNAETTPIERCRFRVTSELSALGAVISVVAFERPFLGHDFADVAPQT